MEPWVSSYPKTHMSSSPLSTFHHSQYGKVGGVYPGVSGSGLEWLRARTALFLGFPTGE